MPIGTLLFIAVEAATAILICVWLIAAFNPRVRNKAGPLWLWRWRAKDPIRGIFFTPEGSFRRYGRVGFVALLVPALIFILFLLSAALWSLVSGLK